MDIKGIGNNANPLYDSLRKQNTTKASPQEDNKDKIEISEEAKQLNSGKLGSEKIAAIKEKVNSGFYNSDAILKELSKNS